MQTKKMNPTLVLRLPEYVQTCAHCKGNGQYQQHYIEGRLTGSCPLCQGAQFVYSATAQPVPESVRRQIASTNDLVESFETTAYGSLVRGHPRLLPRGVNHLKQEFVAYKDLVEEWTDSYEELQGSAHPAKDEKPTAG